MAAKVKKDIPTGCTSDRTGADTGSQNTLEIAAAPAPRTNSRYLKTNKGMANSVATPAKSHCCRAAPFALAISQAAENVHTVTTANPNT